MVNVAHAFEAKSALIALVEQYDISLQVWPHYVFDGGERRPVGFEAELIGSHSLEPQHLDPSCPKCHRVRAALLLIAEYAVKPLESDVEIPLLCDIYSHSASIMCSPRLGNRPMVNVSIDLGCVDHRDDAFSKREAEALNEIRRRLTELRIHEL